LELLREADDLETLALTPNQAQEHILDFLRDKPGALFGEWNMLNRLCDSGTRRQNRVARKFYLGQVGELVRQKKVIRYRKGFLRGKVRISEAFV